MPSSAAIGSSKNKYGAQLHAGNREQLSLFYWSMFSSLLETIDLLFVSNWLGWCNVHPMFGHDEPSVFHSPPSWLLGLLQKTVQHLIISYLRQLSTIKPKAAPRKNHVASSHWAWNCCVRASSTSIIQNACRSQIVYVYRTISQTQTETCDYDGIQAGSVDLRISQRD